MSTVPSKHFVDASNPDLSVMTGHLGMRGVNPAGLEIDVTSRYLTYGGKPWIPVMGEFQYSRYARAEWADALLKMKAGGVDIVATYVVWIHHEERQGECDWSGERSLRDFLQLCRRFGLLAVVRMGPWAHGEARNGGLPDWACRSGRQKDRPMDAAFLKLAEPHYARIVEQMKGLQWKDGGPVIGVQIDNECANPEYLSELKRMARRLGVDVPLYTMTGWAQVPIPQEILLPLFGGYPDGFWVREHGAKRWRERFMFSPVRDHGDMGATLLESRPVDRTRNLDIFPYASCEMGGGMLSCYTRRLRIAPDDCGALALVKMGNGNNLPGYYLYHGGFNPEGKHSTLNEDKATGGYCDLPVKEYNFGPVSACGILQPHYHLFRLQHLFLHDFGSDLATLAPSFPEERPKDMEDVTTLRWSVRTDGRRGFLFFNNYQRLLPLAKHDAVQFEVRLKERTLTLPAEPVAIPSGAYGFWPINMDCGGVTLEHATCQPICRVDADGQDWFFFMALDGIAPVFAVKEKSGCREIRGIKPGTGVAFSAAGASGRKVNFVVLNARQAKQLYKITLAGRPRILLTPDALLPDSETSFRLERCGPEPVELAIFPAPRSLRAAGKALPSTPDGIFQRYQLGLPPSVASKARVVPVRPCAVAGDKSLNAMEEDSWQSAAVWRIELPPEALTRAFLLRARYVGDVARIYAQGKLVWDNFYNGEAFDFALWRLTAAERQALELRVMPLLPDRADALPPECRPDFAQAPFVCDVSSLECWERQQIELRA